MRTLGGLVLLLVLVGCGGPEPRPAPPTTPTTPTTPTPPASPVADVGPTWDPRRVDELPGAAAGVATLLPEVLDPPATAAALAASPVEAAVLALDRARDVLLLATDGSWRSVAVANGSLSPDGTRLLVSGERSADVWDLGSATRTGVPRPPDATGWDYEGWHWAAGGRLLYDDLEGGWSVRVPTGAATRTDHPRAMSFWWDTDPDGAIVESAEHGTPAVLTDWADGTPRRVPMDRTGRLQSPVVNADTVVGTTYDGELGFRLVAARRGDLEPVAVQRLGDHEGNYSNWGLRPLALLGDGTVLLRVAVPGRAAVDGWRVVAWVPRTGDLRLVLRSEGSAVQTVSFARGLL